MNIGSVVLGMMALVIIGIWHPIVIAGEYYFGKKKCMVAFALIGVACIIAALRIENWVLSATVSLFGFSGLWGIVEVIEQEQRVARGWFKANEARLQKEKMQEQNQKYGRKLNSAE